MLVPGKRDPIDPNDQIPRLSEQIQLTGAIDVLSQLVSVGAGATKEVRLLQISTMGGQRLYIYPLDVLQAHDLARRLMRGSEAPDAANGKAPR